MHTFKWDEQIQMWAGFWDVLSPTIIIKYGSVEQLEYELKARYSICEDDINRMLDAAEKHLDSRCKGCA